MLGKYDAAGKRELFIDDFLTADSSNVSFKVHTPRELPAHPGKPNGAYLTFMNDKEKGVARIYCRKYDRTIDVPQVNGNIGEYVFVAESKDGLTWEEPDYGLFPDKPHLPKSTILCNGGFTHNFVPFVDTKPGVPASERYKAVAGILQTGGLFSFYSADGIRWERYTPDTPQVKYMPEIQGGHGLDSQNIAFYSEVEKCYVMYYRVWKTSDGRWRLRTFAKATSDDFINWSEPEWLNPNMPDEHLYVSGLSPYDRAPQYYVGAATRFFKERGAATDISLIFSRNGDGIIRPYPGAWIAPGLDPSRWGNRSNYMAWGIMQTSPEELTMYHGHNSIRYALRTDGFVSLSADRGTGRWLSRVLTGEGIKELEFNVATSAGGIFNVELCRPDGSPIPGFTFADFGGFYGDTISLKPQWNGVSMPEDAAEGFRIRIEMQECDVYSVAFNK